MEKVTNADLDGAELSVKGYRFAFCSLLGILGVFFSVLCFVIVYENRNAVQTQTLITIGVVCGVVAALSIALTVWDKIKEFKITKRPCVLLYSDGMTVYTTKPEKGYFHFGYDEIEDYGFIHIYRSSDCENCRESFTTKHKSADTYLYCNLKNYGYLRITAKDGGYYNVPVGDIEAVDKFLKERTQLKEFRYQRIAGIDDDIIIPLK